MKTIKQVMDSSYFWFFMAMAGMGVSFAAGVLKSVLK